MKIIVYTTNLGHYDKYQPAIKDPLVDYLYYTDGKRAPTGWKKIEMASGDRKASRFYKINSHFLPDHDISIYIDASYKIEKPLSPLIELLGKNDMAMCLHPFDRCVYEHARRCKKLRLEDPQVIRNQIRHYSIKRMPPMFGLTENSLIIRKNNKRVERFNNLWWSEYSRWSQRDQLSCPYALWKSDIKLKILPFSARVNPYLSNWGNHLGKREWK